MAIKRICVHHTGGLLNDPFAKTQDYTASKVNSVHRDRFNFRSTLGMYGGYNFFIDKDGKLTQFRAIGEETAAQRGFNEDTISFCLSGNFSSFGGKMVEKPTIQQQTTLKNALISLFETPLALNEYKYLSGTKMALKTSNIVPHRVLGNTECYGSGLSDNWARDIVIEFYNEKISLLMKLLDLYRKILQLKTKFGSQNHSCLEQNERG